MYGERKRKANIQGETDNGNENRKFTNFEFNLFTIFMFVSSSLRLQKQKISLWVELEKSSINCEVENQSEIGMN